MSSTATPSDTRSDETRGDVYLGVMVGFMVPSLLIITLRTVVRIRCTKMWWDDYLMMAVIPFLVANNGLSIASIHHGVGRHIFSIPPAEAMMAAKLNTIAQPFNIWALFFVKASIMTLLLRLQPGKIYRYILWSTLGLLLSITIASFIITMAQCQPLAKEWNPTLPGTCWPSATFQDAAYILSGCTILTDIVYITIPIVYLWNVQLQETIKYGIWIVLGLGIFSMACSIAAIPFIHALALTQDVTYQIVNLAWIKTAELNIAILTACIPPLQPLFKRIGELISHVPKPQTWESRQAFAKKASNYEMLSGKSRGKSSNVGSEYPLAPMRRTESPATSQTQMTSAIAGEHSVDFETRFPSEPRNDYYLPSPSKAITKTTDFDVDFET